MSDVTKILEFRVLAKDEKIEGLGIVDKGLPVQYNSLLDRFRKDGSSKLLLAWEGTKVPSGVELPNGIIGWTQHGMVTSQEGKQLGYYERYEEFGGPDRNRHTIIITLN